MPPSPLYFYSIHSLLKYKNFTGIISNLVDDYSKSDNPYVTDFKDVIDFNNALHQVIRFSHSFTLLKIIIIIYG